MMKKILILILFLLPWTVAGQTPLPTTVIYREGDAYCREKCRLLISAPTDEARHPVIVWFHGGGLTGGKAKLPETLCKSGHLVISVGYRLVPNVSVAEIIDDAAAAVAWVFANAPRYGGDTTRVFLAGHSAGGYLVSMLGLDKKYLARYGLDADRLAAIVPYSGQSLTHFAERKAHGIDALTPTIDDLAPMAHLRADAPPIFVISGDREKEMNGRYEENAYFVRMLRLNGHPDVRFVELGGFSHGAMAAPAHYLLLQYIRERQ